MTTVVSSSVSKLAPGWWTDLCGAVRDGDISKVSSILGEHGPGQDDDQPNVETILTDNPLHLAVLQGEEKILDALIRRGFDIRSTNLYGETPLHIACRKGYTGMVETLLAAGALIDYKDCGECTPLFHAVNSNQTQAVEILIKAVNSNQTRPVEILIKAGCDLDTLNEELISPLDHAVFYNQGPIISLLLKGGCAIHKTMGLIYSPGHYANSILFSLWANGDVDNVKVLVNAGYKIVYSQFRKLIEVSKQLNWDEETLVTLQEIMHKPLRLTESCRVSIRRYLMEQKVEIGRPVETVIYNLPIPGTLKDFLALRNE